MTVSEANIPPNAIKVSGLDIATMKLAKKSLSIFRFEKVLFCLNSFTVSLANILYPMMSRKILPEIPIITLCKNKKSAMYEIPKMAIVAYIVSATAAPLPKITPCQTPEFNVR